jgi:hypothetical protein
MPYTYVTYNNSTEFIDENIYLYLIIDCVCNLSFS